MKVRTNMAAGRMVATAAAILLSFTGAGCSGSSQKPAAIATTGSASAASSVVATSVTTSALPASTSPSEPVFKFPADYTLTIDPDTTGDPVKDAILADNADFLKAYLSDLASGNANDPVLLKYATPVGAQPWQAAIADARSKGLTITGPERIYHREVYKVDTAKSGVRADVYVCDDQSKSFDKEIATGKVHVTQVADSDYILYFFGLQKSATGTWQVFTSVTHQNDQAVKQQCR